MDVGSRFVFVVTGEANKVLVFFSSRILLLQEKVLFSVARADPVLFLQNALVLICTACSQLCALK
jgi:hypothetical protein